MTPTGMSFGELASMTGGGVQTPGFMGHGRHFIGSKKFAAAEGGIARIVWMPKELKDDVAGRLNATAKELYGIGKNRFAQVVSYLTDLLQGTPSVIIGIITYIWVVVPMKGYSAIAGSVALCIMMLPLIIRSTEETLKILPSSLKEAGLALGGNSARVMLKVQLPAAFGGIFTGVLLAISRVIGETAPLMFTALGCSLIRFSIDKPISAVPLLIWEFFNDPNLQDLIWGASLFLLLFVLTLNLTAKYLAKKWNQ